MTEAEAKMRVGEPPGNDADRLYAEVCRLAIAADIIGDVRKMLHSLPDEGDTPLRVLFRLLQAVQDDVAGSATRLDLMWLAMAKPESAPDERLSRAEGMAAIAALHAAEVHARVAASGPEPRS